MPMATAISAGASAAGKIADVIADEPAAGTVHSPGARDVGFVAVEADIARRLRQAAQQRARSAAYVEHTITAAGSDHLVSEPLQPTPRADQMVEKFINPRAGERGPKTAAFAHVSWTAVGTDLFITRTCERLSSK